jgi:plastocyanin
MVLSAGVLFFAASCNNTTSNGTTCGQTIVIDGFVFTPLELDAEPGETICVINRDAEAHTVTSESAPNAFDDDGRFDSGVLNQDEEGTITIPDNATPGDEIPYYCDVHLGTMDTPNGTITVVAP